MVFYYQIGDTEMTNYKVDFTNHQSITFKANSILSAKRKASSLGKQGYGSLNLIDLDKKETIAFKSELHNVWVKINNPYYLNQCLHN